jgi:hypothetical protein
MITEVQLRNQLGSDFKSLSENEIKEIREFLISTARIEYEVFVQNKKLEYAALPNISQDISKENKPLNKLKIAA